MIPFHASFPSRRILVGLAALTMALAPSVTWAMAGTTGAPGNDPNNTGSGPGIGGSYTFSDPAAVYQGGAGGPGGSGRFGGAGGAGGDGAATSSAGNGTQATIIVQSGTFSGGTGGQGGTGTLGQGSGGNGGNAVSFAGKNPSGSGTDLTATVSGGTFIAGQPGTSGNGTTLGNPGYDFFIQGADVTVDGTFDTPSQTIFFGSGSFTGTLADNTAPATYTYLFDNNTNGPGSLTINSEVSPAPEPAQPATLGLCVLGLGGMIVAARRKKTQPNV